MSFPAPEITEVNRPYWEGLQAGELRYQLCDDCGHGWLPARRYCPNCLSENAKWTRSSGQGRVVSWVVYHRAYADYFKARVPYDVTIVELDEGPRLLSNVVDSEAGSRLFEGARVTLAIEVEEGVALAKFRLVSSQSR